MGQSPNKCGSSSHSHDLKVVAINYSNYYTLKSAVTTVQRSTTIRIEAGTRPASGFKVRFSLESNLGEKKYKTLVIIPVYNEENRIKTVLERFKGVEVDKVLVVNDGSTDGTPEVIKSFGVEAFSHTQRQGVGSSIRDGIDHARKNGYNLVVVMAGNGKDDPKEIPILLKPIIEKDCDYIQGSRYLEGGEAGNLPLARKIGIKAFTFLWSLFLWRKLTDVTNGFRAYKVSLFDNPQINIWQEWLSTYELEYYIHFWVLKLKYRFGEVPVSKIYPSKKKYSKIRPFLDWWSIVKPLFYLMLRIRK